MSPRFQASSFSSVSLNSPVFSSCTSSYSYVVPMSYFLSTSPCLISPTKAWFWEGRDLCFSHLFIISSHIKRLPVCSLDHSHRYKAQNTQYTTGHHFLNLKVELKLLFWWYGRLYALFLYYVCVFWFFCNIVFHL
jgi:hypothetical protein